jgi:hypothetical protein
VPLDDENARADAFVKLINEDSFIRGVLDRDSAAEAAKYYILFVILPSFIFLNISYISLPCSSLGF